MSNRLLPGQVPISLGVSRFEFTQTVDAPDSGRADFAGNPLVFMFQQPERCLSIAENLSGDCDLVQLSVGRILAISKMLFAIVVAFEYSSAGASITISFPASHVSGGGTRSSSNAVAITPYLCVVSVDGLPTSKRVIVRPLPQPPLLCHSLLIIRLVTSLSLWTTHQATAYFRGVHRWE
jgi:hypothetical protein